MRTRMAYCDFYQENEVSAKVGAVARRTLDFAASRGLTARREDCFPLRLGMRREPVRGKSGKG